MQVLPIRNRDIVAHGIWEVHLQLSVCSPPRVTEETSSFRVMFFRLSFIRVFFRPGEFERDMVPVLFRHHQPLAQPGCPLPHHGNRDFRTVPVPEGFSTLMTYIHTPTASTMARTILKILRFFFGLVTILLPFLSRTAGKVCALPEALSSRGSSSLRRIRPSVSGGQVPAEVTADHNRNGPLPPETMATTASERFAHTQTGPVAHAQVFA